MNKSIVLVFVLVLIAITIEVNGSTQPLTDDSQISKLRVESAGSKDIIILNAENNHGDHQHPHGRNGRCFFSSPSGSSSSAPSPPNWQFNPRVQNVGTGQGYSKYPTWSYPFTSYID